MYILNMYHLTIFSFLSFNSQLNLEITSCASKMKIHVNNIFRYRQHNNTEKYRKGRPHVRIRCNSWDAEPDIEYRYCGDQPDKTGTNIL